MALLCVKAAHQTSRLAADMYGRSVSANRGGTVGGSGRGSRGSRRRLAGTHAADNEPQRHKGEDRDGGRGEGVEGYEREKPARTSSPSARILGVLRYRRGRRRERGSEDLTRRGSGSGSGSGSGTERKPVIRDQYDGRRGGESHFCGFVSTKKEQKGGEKKTGPP